MVGQAQGAADTQGFRPDAARGRAVDAGVRARLADSLRHLAGAVDGRPGVVAVGGLQALADSVQAHPVRPGVMALYADAVEALLGADGTAADLLATLAAPHWRGPAAPRVVTLHDCELGAGMADRYARHLQDEPGPGFTALAPAALDRERRRLGDARALLEAVHPALHAEIDALTPEIVLVGTSDGPDGYVFHGASSFYVWGALALNAAEHKTRVELVQGVVHEAGHGLLHGLTLGAPLVTNDPADRYASPLRDDPRPMEGLVHAAYVLARMHLAMDALARSAAVPAAEREEASARGRDAAAAFAAALATIDAHASFTAPGGAIFAGARSYMAACRAS